MNERRNVRGEFFPVEDDIPEGKTYAEVARKSVVLAIAGYSKQVSCFCSQLSRADVDRWHVADASWNLVNVMFGLPFGAKMAGFPHTPTLVL